MIHAFGQSELTNYMIANAKKFLIKCLSPSHKCTHFDDLRYDVYHEKKFHFDLEKFPATSESMKQHIRRAYFQAYLWQHALFVDQILLIPEEYGYVEDEIGQFKPLIMSAPKLPNDFPVPYNRLKCARENVCLCRVKQVACCQFYKCEGARGCRNPANTQSSN